MAKMILMKHRDSGLVSKSYTGFSWTCLFFGPFVPMVRGDWRGAAIWWSALIICAVIAEAADLPESVSFGMAIGMAGLYNRMHARSLLSKGYQFSGTELENKLAAYAAGAVV